MTRISAAYESSWFMSVLGAGGMCLLGSNWSRERATSRFKIH